MTFSKSISVCFSKYATFEGRARRSEYWWFFLFSLIASIVLSILDTNEFSSANISITVNSIVSSILDTNEVLINAFSIIMFLPSLAVSARRLHDTGRSGWWQMMYFTVVGIPILIYWLAIEGNEGKNSYDIPNLIREVKDCPECAEEILFKAKKCKHCGSAF